MPDQVKWVVWASLVFKQPTFFWPVSILPPAATALLELFCHLPNPIG